MFNTHDHDPADDDDLELDEDFDDLDDEDDSFEDDEDCIFEEEGEAGQPHHSDGVRYSIANLINKGRWDDIKSCLTSYDWLLGAVEEEGWNFSDLISHCESVASHPDSPLRGLATLLAEVIRLSVEILGDDAAHLPSQLLGRLLSVKDPEVQLLLNDVIQRARRPWLRPRTQCLVSPGDPPFETLEESHEGYSKYSCVSVSPDGRLAVSGLLDGTLQVWDLEIGILLRSYDGHKGAVTSIELILDGDRVISTSQDGTLKVWSLKTGAMLNKFDCSGPIAFTPDGGRMVSAMTDGTLRLWDLKTGAMLRPLVGHEAKITSVAMTPDGRRAFSGSADGMLQLWDLETGAVRWSFKGDNVEFPSVSVNSDGIRGFSWSDSQDDKRGISLKVWNLATGNLVHAHQIPMTLGKYGHRHYWGDVLLTRDGRRAVIWQQFRLIVWDLETDTLKYAIDANISCLCVSLTHDGRRIVVGQTDCHCMLVFDLETGTLLRELEGETTGELTVSLSFDGRRAVSANGITSLLRVWDLESGTLLQELDNDEVRVESISLSEGSCRAVALFGDNKLKVWDLKFCNLCCSLEGHSAGVTTVSTAPSAGRAVAGLWDGTLKLWDLETGTLLKEFKEHKDAIISLALTPDGHHAVSGSVDRTIKVWDLEAGKLRHTFEHQNGPATALALTPDGSRAVSMSSGGTLKLWDLDTATLRHTLKSREGLRDVALTPNGRRALSRSSVRDRESYFWEWKTVFMLWDLDNGTALDTFEHKGDGSVLALTPDGRRAVSGGSRDAMLKVWDLETGRLVSTLDTKNESVRWVTITPDARRVLLRFLDILQVWDLEPAKLVHTLKDWADDRMPASLTPDGRLAIAGSEDKTLQIWDLEHGEPISSFAADAAITAVACGADGQSFYAGDAHGRVHFLHLESGC